MAELTCPHCGAPVSADDVYCPNCTRALRLAAPEAPYEGPKPRPVRTVSWIVGLGLLGLCALAAFPLLVIPRARNVAGGFGSSPPAVRTACIANLKQLAVAGLIYQADYDDRNFPKLTFSAELAPYVKSPPVFNCPQTGRPYATNKEYLGVEAKKVKDPVTLIYFYEGAAQKLAFPHGGVGNVAYADGHAKGVPKTYKPNWKP